jgi:hypothetical protein
MNHPVKYDYIEPLAFGGTLPESATFDTAKAVILPVPLESTTSYVNGTKNGPREILIASSHLELWDEEMNTDVHGVGIFTLPEMELPFDNMSDLVAEIRRVVADIVKYDKFPFILGPSSRRSRPSIPDCLFYKSMRTPTSATPIWAPASTMRARCGACSTSRARLRWEFEACRPKRRRPRPAWRRRSFSM